MKAAPTPSFPMNILYLVIAVLRALAAAWRSRSETTMWRTIRALLVVVLTGVFLALLALGDGGVESSEVALKDAARRNAAQAFVAGAGGGASLSRALSNLEATPVPTEETSEPTLGQSPINTNGIPPEYLANQNQTTGIILAAALLVLIVVFGVLAFLPRKEAGRR